MRQIKAIGFDFGGVIGGGPNIGHEFTKASADLLGVTTEVWRKVYFSINNLINTDKKSKRDFWLHFLKEFNQTDKIDQVLAQDLAMAKRYLVVNQQIISLIDQFRERGYKVGLLSNASGEVANNIKTLNLAGHFDSFLFSAEIGVQKPDIAAFEYLAKSLGADLADLIFIDDAEPSLKTASQAGFTPILFKSYEQLVEELTKLRLLQSVP